MFRYCFTIEYDGSYYVGWQRQKNGISVQGVIEDALFALTKETVTVYGAGRTDSGVHALGQVAHVDLIREWCSERLCSAMNAHLRFMNAAVSIIDVKSVNRNFDARFSALRRHYLYRIIIRRSPLCLEKGRAWWVPKNLDYEAMHEAAQLLVGQHDFTTFRSVHCQAITPVRTLDSLTITSIGNIVEIKAVARSFLHHQIRSFVGSLKLVGEGKWTSDNLKRALDACDRKACGPVAPAEGLYFLHVEYPGSG
ncbi:tRNA pseudouridine synthase A [Liberibacter crescens BT-1]|uniref:tRNA pseudouridine synthase A n=1 Tax=Liberibacter crescens (strain BT-1) TaxID=1215343 RepID=L0EWI3_LIBCB|nr:tRNA pseudouridine(38-40) synthase TruA [Liberibacter crescens]AGA65322.1 tRNA pseudouridine synthase A [Liberibacter crescens BT-1]AMC13251.1 pseudouridine synthase [Liberibacter crescens]